MRDYDQNEAFVGILVFAVAVFCVVFLVEAFIRHFL